MQEGSYNFSKFKKVARKSFYVDFKTVKNIEVN